MMLPPQLLSALEKATAKEDFELSRMPVLPVEGLQASSPSRAADGPDWACFTFTPQRIAFEKEDDFFEDGDICRHLYLQDAAMAAMEEVERPRVPEFGCHIAGCCQLFDTLESYEHHYNTQHRNVCSHCKRAFPSAHLLDIHITEWHDPLFQILAEKQTMYRCLVESCSEKFGTSRDRKDHLIRVHSYPSNFRFEKPKKAKSCAGQQKGEPQKAEAAGMIVDPPQPPMEPVSSDPMEVSPAETMETDGVSESGEKKTDGTSGHMRPCYTHRVPATICFGHGSVRGFRGTRKKK
ncbi:zinc finger protein 511 isoform X2 [Latimeria chalumnae]|nr:PREDICTED: zinc finger protein 511 isoform X2 [Latimeria chalumnae]|eukprot:XP_014348493.1 PREDICTED: zinc finger protein 511 isoform X2 [Latimeria chalumnae]